MECAFVLEKSFSAPRQEIAPTLVNIISLPHVLTEYKSSLLKALTFWQINSSLDFADCYHLALAEELGMTQVYSFDKKMDRYRGIERIEPEMALVDDA
jgi:predicted nucleic acid-binding protein